MQDRNAEEPLDRCQVCGENRWSVVRKARDFRRPGHPKVFLLRRCLACGHIMQNPLPGAEELKSAYAVEYAPYRPAWKEPNWPVWKILRRLTTAKRMRRLNRFSNGTRLLEVGSGAGDFLYAAKSAGWEVAAVEYNESLVQTLRHDLNIDIHAGQLREGLWEPGSFDVVALWSVLEHVIDPSETLRIAASYLRPKGIMLLQLPNAPGVALGKAFGESMELLDQPRHINFFGKESLGIICKLHGLEVTVFKTDFLDTAWGYVASSRNVLNKAQGLPGKFFKAPLLALFILLNIPYLAIQSWRKRGTEAFAVAVKSECADQ